MTSLQNERSWPTLDGYDNALKDPTTSVYDFDIREERLLFDCRPMRLNVQSSKYVTVYKLGGWVVKCFFTNPINVQRIIKPPPDIVERYQKINDYVSIHQQRLPFLVPQIWVESAIHIYGQVWPFIKSKFIQAQTLGEFLGDMHQNQVVVAELAKQWLAMINTLEALSIAHGDLDLTNVLVSGAYPNLSLRLVDFDSMYVPALYGRTMFEQGHEHFQAPPELRIRNFNPEMDRFSALVIYLSLIALAEDWQLWNRCKANEETKLLLGSGDYRNLSNSSGYNLLRMKQYNRELQLCLDELANSISEARAPRSISDVLSSSPSGSVITAQLPSQLSLSYIAPPIPIPLSFIKVDETQPLQHPPMTIPIPVSYLQLPAEEDQSAPAADKPTVSRINLAILAALAILTVVLAITIHPIILILTLLLIIIMIVVARNSRK